jgi:hypothetical protein
MAKRPIAIVQANSWGLRLRSQRSKVLRPKATAIMKDAAASAVLRVTVPMLGVRLWTS